MASSSTDATPAQPQLNVFDAVNIIVGIVVGTTIYKLPGSIFNMTSDPWTGLLVWFIGGLIALIGALCYAELATTYPRSGGDYVYLTRSFGPWCGFLFGWAQLAVVLTASTAAMAFVFGFYATKLYEFDGLKDWGIDSSLAYAYAAVLALSLLNLVGVTFGKWTQNLLSVAKLLGLVCIIVAGFGWPASSPAEWPKPEFGDMWIGPLALIFVLYAYGGWNDAAFVAAEVRDPRRNIPRALLFGVGLIALVYLLVNFAYITGLGYGVARGGDLLPTTLMEKVVLNGEALGERGAQAISVLIMISALGAVNGLIFAGTRVYATLGNDHPLLGWLGHWKPGRGAPTLALLAQAVITLGMIYLFGTEQGYDLGTKALAAVGLTVTPREPWKLQSAFDNLIAETSPVFWTFFLMTGFSLFILRGRDAGLPRPFTVPLYPLLPFVFCLVCFFMLYNAVEYAGYRSLLGFGVTLVGLPLYAISRLIGYRDSSAIEPLITDDVTAKTFAARP